MDSKLVSVVDDLKAEEEKVKTELAETKKRQQELQKELKRIQAGISGLQGKGSKKGSSPSAKKTTSADNKGLREQVEAEVLKSAEMETQF